MLKTLHLSALALALLTTGCVPHTAYKRTQPRHEALPHCQGLKAWYDMYNRDYFADKLPKDTVVEERELEGHLYAQTIRINGVFHIVLDPRYNVGPQTQHLTEVHEICHIPTWDIPEVNDGPKWRACMDRLWLQGALDGLL